MKNFVLLTVLALGFHTFHLHAQNPGAPAAEDGGGWVNLVMVLEVYALDREPALAVLDGAPGSSARYSRVKDLFLSGKARLDTLTAISTKSGQRALVEACDEVRYPTSFAAPVGMGALASPQSFEMRNAGDTLELEPVFDPEDPMCHLNFVPQKVALLGFRDSQGMEGDSPISEPIFQTQKVTTSVTLPINEPHFFGTMSAPGQRGPGEEMCLAFIRANASGPMASELKPREKPADWSVINLEYRFFSMERAAAREILASSSTMHAPWARTDALLREKKARLEHHVQLQTKSGQRSVVEEIREVRYAAAMEPASSERKTTRTTNPPAPQANDRNPSAVETTAVTRDLPPGEFIPGMPTEIETRNVGVTVEVEPVVGPDGLTVHLNHVPHIVAHLDDFKPTGIAARYPPQPLFETRRITTSMSVLAGQWTLVGTMSHPGANGVNGRTDDGRTWILFVRATPPEP